MVKLTDDTIFIHIVCNATMARLSNSLRRKSTKSGLVDKCCVIPRKAFTVKEVTLLRRKCAFSGSVQEGTNNVLHQQMPYHFRIVYLSSPYLWYPDLVAGTSR